MSLLTTTLQNHLRVGKKVYQQTYIISRHARALYNSALYIQRQRFFSDDDCVFNYKRMFPKVFNIEQMDKCFIINNLTILCMVDVAEFIVNNWVWVLVFALLSFMHFSRRLSQWESDIKDSQNFDYFISAIVIIIVGTVSFGTYQLYTADLGEPQQYVDSVVRGDTGMLEMFVIFTMISVITFGILMIMNQTRRG